MSTENLTIFFYPKKGNQKIFKKLLMNYFTTLKIDFLIRKTMANLDTVFIFINIKKPLFLQFTFFSSSCKIVLNI